eukprot:GHVU01057301.1.p1 GENE.GHVU01057301.1~~GHVU01057301.1.p1  ORF type:complete len:257 (-),score=27.98 GHVU01057301.1:282-1052(-)
MISPAAGAAERAAVASKTAAERHQAAALAAKKQSQRAAKAQEALQKRNAQRLSRGPAAAAAAPTIAASVVGRTAAPAEAGLHKRRAAALQEQAADGDAGCRLGVAKVRRTGAAAVAVTACHACNRTSGSSTDTWVTCPTCKRGFHSGCVDRVGDGILCGKCPPPQREAPTEQSVAPEERPPLLMQPGREAAASDDGWRQCRFCGRGGGGRGCSWVRCMGCDAYAHTGCADMTRGFFICSGCSRKQGSLGRRQPAQT